MFWWFILWPNHSVKLTLFRSHVLHDQHWPGIPARPLETLQTVPGIIIRIPRVTPPPPKGGLSGKHVTKKRHPVAARIGLDRWRLNEWGQRELIRDLEGDVEGLLSGSSLLVKELVDEGGRRVFGQVPAFLTSIAEGGARGSTQNSTPGSLRRVVGLPSEGPM
ncbi:hypothetical protein MLD38_013512 [Melastoma candidum]|uniref:Uncharacterized protein n=1 Tax=Melastoma candidum TaxID=119954 RepID=A0ACB9RAE5_9MYRT|nr:hypothetical protein MLD38_013512 [Melastoma candidum]